MLGWAPPPGTGRASAPPRWRTSTLSGGVLASGPATATRASIAAAGKSARNAPSPSPDAGWLGLAGVHVQLAERGGGDHREGVQFRAEPAQRLDQLGTGARVAEIGSLNHGEGPAAQRFGDLG